MRLQRVTYGVFKHEVGGPWADDVGGWHQLDGEVVLEFSDGTATFVSWCNRPVQYSIGCNETSHFSPRTLSSVEMTAHTFWRQLVGSDVRLGFIDEQHQVLAVEANGHAVYLSSQYRDGDFLGDCVRVAAKSPL